jgi:hypothetical protein
MSLYSRIILISDTIVSFLVTMSIVCQGFFMVQRCGDRSKATPFIGVVESTAPVNGAALEDYPRTEVRLDFGH